jgi:hypothetical protein
VIRTSAPSYSKLPRSKFNMGITVLVCYHLGDRRCMKIPVVDSDSAELESLHL